MHQLVQFQVMTKGIQEDRLNLAQENQLAAKAADKKHHIFPHFPNVQKVLVRSLSGVVQAIRIIRHGARVHA